MIITRTPLRVSLFGGGTDHPQYYQHAPSGGAVLGFALSHYTYLTVRDLPHFHEHNVRLVYSRIELTDHADALIHPAARAVLTQLGRPSNIEVTHAADLPSRAGLGSSSAFVVGLITAIDALSGRRDGPGLLARRAIHLEREVMAEPGGHQDQIFSAYGDLLRVDFPRAGAWAVRRPMVPARRQQALLDHLLLAFTGEVRDAPQIAASLDLSPSSPYLSRMRGQVDEAEAILLGEGPIETLGKLLDEAWGLKRRLSPAVSTPWIDALYADARRAGAIGGKLLGAGGGGFLLLVARPEDHARVRAALPSCVFVPVGIDRVGSTVVVNGWSK